jgi:PucR C-terminal helix-turn-helix domain/GGDEF-like domain
MATATRWQDAVLAAGRELGAERLGAIAADALVEQLPRLNADPDLRDAARASVLANVGLIVEVMAGSVSLSQAAPPPAAIAFTRELARRNVPVAELDRAYRVAQHALWRWAIGEVRARIADPAALAEAAEGLSEAAFVTGDVLISSVMERYAAERERWVRSADAVRGATVDELLSGGGLDADAAARRLGYDLRGEHQAFVVWAESVDAVPETAAAAAGGARALLVPRGVGVMAGWAPAGTVDPAAAPGAEVALGTPGRGVAGFRRSHREAMEARRVARALGLRGPVRYPDVALLALLTQDLEQARDFARRTLGPLADDDAAARRLAETLQVFLEEQGSPRRAGRRLGVHENTVAKRMRTIDRRLDPDGRAGPAELLAALAIVRAEAP